MSNLVVLIMAGGLGKRMNSDIPKVLHNVDFKQNLPMIVHVILTAISLNPAKIFIIVGKYKSIIEETINKYVNSSIIEYVIQADALGTGHAIKCSLDQIKNYVDCKALILSGDVPLISSNTLNNLYYDQSNKLLVTELDDPTGCGRIILDIDHNILKIVEQKDCNDLEKNINLVNCGIYQIKVCDLLNLIPLISNNNKAGEYYLTDIIQLMIENNIKINYYNLPQSSHYEIKNVNSQKDLNDLNEFVKNNL